MKKSPSSGRSADPFPWHIVVPAGILTTLFWNWIKPIVQLLNGEKSLSGFVVSAPDFFWDILGTIQMVLTTTAIVGTLLLAAFVGLRLWFAYGPTKLQEIRIQLQDDMKVDIQKVVRLAEGMSSFYPRKWWQRLFLPRTWITWRVIRDFQGKYAFRCLVPTKKVFEVKRKIELAYPGAVVDPGGAPFIAFLKDGDGHCGHMKMARKKGYGLKNQAENNMGDIISMMPKGSVLEVRFSPSSYEELQESGQEQVRELQDKDHKIREDAKNISDITERYWGRSAFDVSITLWSKKGSLDPLKGQIITLTKGQNNSLSYHPYHWAVKWRNPLTWWFTTPLPSRRITLNDRELSHFLMLPDPSHKVVEHIDLVVSKVLPDKNDLKGHLRIGKVDDPYGNHRDARIHLDTVSNHGVIAGMSGGGKGAVFNDFCEDFFRKWVNDPDNHPGLTYGDPHRNGIENCINLLLELENEGETVPWDRVMVLSVGPSEYPAALNLLHREPEESIDDVAAETVDIIMSAFQGDLSRSKIYLENAIHGLLWDKQPHTMADIGRIFKARESGLRRQIMKHLKNKMVLDWFKEDLEPKFKPRSKKDEPKDVDVEAINTRIRPFLTKQSMQRIFAQPDNILKVDEIFEQGKLVFIDFKGAPDEAYKLIAGYITNRYFREAQRRGTNGRPHVLVFDECQKFHVPRFVDVLKENRKFHMGLILMTQEIENLDKDLKSAIKTNSGFIVSVAQGDGAKDMSDLMRKQFSPTQLQSLKKHRNKKGQIEKIEAALWSIDGSSHITVPPPAFRLNGQLTAKGSTEEATAKEQVNEKIKELLKRDSKHYTEIDRLLAGETIREQPKEKRMDEQTQETSAPKANDPQLERAIQIVIQEQKASASMLQKELGIGRKKADELLDALEQRKIIGPKNGKQPRAVLVKGRYAG